MMFYVIIEAPSPPPPTTNWVGEWSGRGGKFAFGPFFIKGNSLRIVGEYSRILKNNDSVVFLITKNRVEYSGVIFRSIIDFWKQNGVFV
jgi:hypothetical protein